MNVSAGGRARGQVERNAKRSAGRRKTAGGAAGSPRGGHVVDLALLFAELARAPGVTQADLGRRYRKSAGYVSVVCRLGRALGGLPPEGRDRLRVPHFTLKAAQTLVSRHPDPAALRAAALQLASAPPPPRKRVQVGVPGQWDRAPNGPDAMDPLPEPPEAPSQRRAFVYTWDAEAARRDPAAVLAGFEAFVREATDEIVSRLRQSAGDLGPGQARPAHRASVRGSRSTPAGYDEISLRQLHERVRAMLRDHRERMQEFLAERERARSRPPVARIAPDSVLPAADVDATDIEADLG